MAGLIWKKQKTRKNTDLSENMRKNKNRVSEKGGMRQGRNRKQKTKYRLKKERK